MPWLLRGVRLPAMYKEKEILLKPLPLQREISKKGLTKIRIYGIIILALEAQNDAG